MAKCIYCGADADSGEHWMPKTFGTFKNFEQLFDRLCADCNKALGDELDQEVANTGTTALAKAHLGIEGRHKGKPSKNPFQYRVMGSEAATTVRLDSPDGTHKVLGEFFKTPTGETRLIAARQLVFKKGDGAIVPVNFPRGYTVDLLKKLLKVRGVEGATLFEMYLENGESHEDEALRALLRDAVGPYSVTVFGGVGESAGRKDVRIESNISLAYLRGIAKIAFHYYLKMSNVHTGGELHFQPLRRFIRYGEGDPENFVILIAPHFIEGLAKGESPDAFCPFLALYKFDSFLTVVLQLFVGPEHVTYPSLVLLGISQKRVAHRVHQFTYFDGKMDNFDGELTELPDVKLVRLDRH